MARNKYDIDENLEENFDLSQLRRLGQYLSPHKGGLIWAAFLMLSSSATALLIPVLFARIMDECIPNADMSGIVFYTLITAAISLYGMISLRAKVRITAEIGQSVIHRLRRDLFEHLQALPFSYFDQRPHGKIQVRVVNYINNLSDLLSNGIINTLTDVCSLFFILFFMFYLNVEFTLISLCGLPVLTAIVLFIKKKQRRAWRIQSNKQSNLNAYIAESISGIHVTQAFVREEKNTGIFNSLSGQYRSAWMKAVRLNFILGPGVDIISIITISLIYVLGIYGIQQGSQTITAGTLIAFAAYVSRFWQPVNTLASFYNSLLTAVSYLERIFETIDEPLPVKDTEDASDIPSIRGEVEFRNVSFCYDEGIRILDQVSFKAEAGESFALVGPTGAGKTTIVNLISRFYNVTEGSIFIDGYDIAGVTLHSLRSQMGVMMQDSFIFSGTIMDNIRYGNMEASDEEVIEAAKTVCAHDFIAKLAEGYNTQVGERGGRLSAGQRQLISFARALLAKPAILILDEATSSIDTETEMLLQKGLKELLKGRTSFLIAHRLSTIKSADCILYVEGGRIAEKGSHNELIATKGRYYELYCSQYAFLKK